MAVLEPLVHAASMLSRLAAFCFVHRRITLLTWVLLVVAALFAASASGGEYAAGTARVITAAAAIMVCVFGTFVLGDIRAIKLIGLGLPTHVNVVSVRSLAEVR